MKEQSYLEMVNEAVEEEKAIIAEVIEEEIKPLIDYRMELEKKAFEEMYKELKELEEV